MSAMTSDASIDIQAKVQNCFKVILFSNSVIGRFGVIDDRPRRPIVPINVIGRNTLLLQSTQATVSNHGEAGIVESTH